MCILYIYIFLFEEELCLITTMEGTVLINCIDLALIVLVILEIFDIIYNYSYK